MQLPKPFAASPFVLKPLGASNASTITLLATQAIFFTSIKVIIINERLMTDV